MISPRTSLARLPLPSLLKSSGARHSPPCFVAYAAAAHAAPLCRLLASCTALRAQSLPPRPKPPPDSEIEEYFVKGSGPGGQKINKTNSAVQLKHIPTGIVVKSQATRSRTQNRKHARQLLAQRLDELANGDQSRAATVGQVKKKRADSAAKKSRRKYKKLHQDQNSHEAAEGADPEPRHVMGDAPEHRGKASLIGESQAPGPVADENREHRDDASITTKGTGSQSKPRDP